MWFGRLIMSDRESGDELQQGQGTLILPYCCSYSFYIGVLLCDTLYPGC